MRVTATPSGRPAYADVRTEGDIAKARDHARALAQHEAGTGKRRVSRYSRLSNPTAADPARGSFTPSRKSRKRRG